MINLKNLPYVSYKETKNNGRAELKYLTFRKKSESDYEAGVWTKAVQCGSINVSDEATALDVIQNQFIVKVKQLKKAVINIKKSYIKSDINIISETINIFLKGIESKSIEYFAFVPKDLEVNLYPNIVVIQTDRLTDEIIFGKKSLENERGIVLLSYDEGLQNLSDLHYAIVDIGIFPETAYRSLKLVDEYEEDEGWVNTIIEKIVK